MADQLIETSKTTRYLPVKYADTELLEIGRELARKQGNRNQLELDKKSAIDSFKNRISQVEAEISALGNDLTTGVHFENVKCEVVKDFSTGRCAIARTDTGEVIEERKLTEEELQMGLAIGEETDEEVK